VKTDADSDLSPASPLSSVAQPPSRASIFLRYWLPVVIWCAVIVGFSSDAGSSRRTSRIIGPVLRWLVPGISEETVYRVQYGIRKAAHVTEYALLALLIWRARRRPVRGDARPWRWPEAWVALACAALFAVSDEIHQAFVPGREGRATDVLIDSIGALTGLLALRAYGKWRGRW
jgi:VanZ family protein